MLEFGKLEIVEKTFVRENSSPRGQAYNGIKYRRFESTKGKKEAEEAGEPFTPFIDENFTISNNLWDKLKLDTYALTQANTDDAVLLLVVEDQDEKAPVAKFLRQSTKKDGTVQKKGKFFSNVFLSEALVAKGVLKADGLENQYLTIGANLKDSFAGVPDHVQGIYQIVVDTTVNAEEDKEAVVDVAEGAEGAEGRNF